MRARFDPRPSALALLEAFRAGEPISALPQGAEPATAQQARRVARLVVEDLGLAVVGFRVRADGIAGPLLETRIVRSGAVIPISALPGIEATAACVFPLTRSLPPAEAPYTPRRVLGALGPGRAAIDLAAWRTGSIPPTIAGRIADLAGLGMIVFADPPRGTVAADPRALRVAWNDAAPVVVDASARLLAAAEAARLAGGLPVGAALIVGGLSTATIPAPGDVLSARIVAAGRARVTCV